MRTVVRAAAPLLLVVAGLVAAAPAHAEPGCERAFTLSLLDVRYEVAPAARDRLGLTLVGRGGDIGWGRGCDQRRHRITATELDAPAFGTDETTVLRVGAYRRAWSGPGWSLHVGLRGLVRWGDGWRFATPVVGGSLRLGPRLLARAELDLGGLALLAGDVRRTARTDLTFDASVVWPDQAATRGELHARLRDLGFGDGGEVRTVTVSAGIGLAWASREQIRAIPGFVGLAAERDGAAGEHRLLATVAWSLGVTGR